MKFRKKPVVIEAFQMTEGHRWDNSKWPNWLHKAWNREPGENAVWIDPDGPVVPGHHSAAELVCGTLEGVCRIERGDWIIRGIKGELYACKPDIFDATYERVVSEAEAASERPPPGRSEAKQVAEAVSQGTIDSRIESDVRPR